MLQKPRACFKELHSLPFQLPCTRRCDTYTIHCTQISCLLVKICIASNNGNVSEVSSIIFVNVLGQWLLSWIHNISNRLHQWYLFKQLLHSYIQKHMRNFYLWTVEKTGSEFIQGTVGKPAKDGTKHPDIHLATPCTISYEQLQASQERFCSWSFV